MIETEIKVPVTHVEAPYGHVHHAQTLRYLESARLELLNRAGVPNQELMAQGLLLVIARIDVRYLREIMAGSYVVTCENLRISRKLIVLKQRILNSRRKVAVEAEVESVFIDSKLRRSILPPGKFIEALEALTGGAL